MSIYTPYIQKLEFGDDILSKNFDLIKTNYENLPKFNLGYHYYTKQVREKMHLDEFKRRNYYLIVNQFESSIPDYKDDLENIISKKLKFDKNTKVMTRDFYKLWEMLVYFDLLDGNNVKTLTLSENGGFLQCINEFRNYYYSSSKDEYCYHSKDNKDISECLQGNIKKNKIKLVNTNHMENLTTTSLLSTKNEVNKLIKDNKLSNIDLITGNGSYNNFNNNLESNTYNHILGLILTALIVQKENGTFILRIEDCFTDVTVKLLNILGNCYKETFVCKPLFSRSFNNERYLVCKNFKLSSSNRKKLVSKIENLLDDMNNAYNNNSSVFDIVSNFSYDKKLEESISEMNNKLTSNEHLNINKIISYKNGKNYFGEQYHKFRQNQINANKWWEETFIKDKAKQLNDVRKQLVF